MTRFFARAALGAILLAGSIAPAFAHVTLETAEAPLGSTYKAVLRIPHGCSGEATNTVRVQIPEGFYSAKPMPKAGWTLETVTGSYEGSYDDHGTAVTEGVKEIIWSGGELLDAWYDEFVFRGTVANSLEPGPLRFPTIQECANGQEAWVDVDGAMPAPSVQLVAATAGAEHHNHGAPAAAAPLTVGDITIEAPFTRATLPNAPVGGGFFTIVNNGQEDDRLVSAESTIAKDTQIHEMAMEGDVMKMRHLDDGLVIPAGGSVTLEPGGFHLMFMGLNGPIVEGDKVSVTLTFEKAGTITLDLVAAGSAADAPAHDHGAMQH